MSTKDFSKGASPGSSTTQNVSASTAGSGGPLLIVAGNTNTGQSSDEAPPYLINYNEKFKNADPTLFRDKIIEHTITALISKNKPNALLVGSAGVGKTKVVEDIARRLANDDISIPSNLKGYTIYEMPIGEFTQGQSHVGDIEARATELVEFISDPSNKAIVFVDEMHTLMTSKIADPAVQILKGPMARGEFRIIGATTTQEARFLNSDPALTRRFERITVGELTVEQTYEIVKLALPGLRKHYSDEVIVDDSMSEEIVKVAETILPDTYHRPDNALTLIDRAMAQMVLVRSKLSQGASASTMLNGGAMVIPALPLNSKTLKMAAERIRSGDVTVPSFDTNRIRNEMETKVLGQSHLIDQTLDLIRRRKLELFPSEAPLSMMFIGPSGVGKTSLAHIIAQEVTGQDALVLNMSEYNEAISTTKLLGSPDGYIGSDSKKELPFDSLTSNPNRVIVLDELEKAHPKVIELLLGVLDSGRLDNSHGTSYSFGNAIIIATTNAGRSVTDRDALGFGSTTQTNAQVSKESLTKALRESFTPEFLGRFTDMFSFNSLSEDTYKEICISLYEREKNRITRDMPNVTLPDALTDDQVEDLMKTRVPKLGARPARNAVSRLIEDIAVIS